MIVRDKTKKSSEYGGRPTTAIDELCPCRPCYSPHDVSRSGEPVRMVCATNANHGCPDVIPEPVHVPGGAQGKSKTCRRCGCSTAKVLSWDQHARLKRQQEAGQ